MKKIKWGVIGCGGIADRRAIPGMLKAENTQCVAVMDLDEKRALEVREKYNIPYSFTLEEELLSLDEIDAVYIATPVFCHKEQVMKAADCGKHILLEKPMGITAEEAREIADYCKKKNVILGIGFMMRFHDVHSKIKKEIEDGQIGEIVSAYAKFNCWYPVSKSIWRQTKAFSGGGAMMDMGIHCVDLLQYLTSLKAREVTAMCTKQIFEYPDTETAATAVMRMDNGSLFTIEANFNIPDEIGGCKFEIYGTKGKISAVGTIGQTESGTAEITVKEDESTQSRVLEYTSGNMYTKETELFSDAVINGKDAPVTPEEALFNQKITEAVYMSQESGKRIVL